MKRHLNYVPITPMLYNDFDQINHLRLLKAIKALQYFLCNKSSLLRRAIKGVEMNVIWQLGLLFKINIAKETIMDQHDILNLAPSAHRTSKARRSQNVT